MLKTAREVEVKIRAGKRGRWAVGDGVYLDVAQGGTATWTFRYKFGNKGGNTGLGSVRLVTLAEAREQGRKLRRQIMQGIDPVAEKKAKRQQARLEQVQRVTFEDAAERFINNQAPGWRSPKHKGQWLATLQTYAFPVFGQIAVADIDTGLVLRALEPIWAVKSETASRVRGRIEAVLDWAKVRGYRDGENPARWRGHLDQVLPARRKLGQVEHLAALPYTEAPAFMADLRQRNGVPARALEFCILTAVRSGEVRSAEWDHIDLDAGVWTIPADRMKGGREHRVPLSDRALEVLHDLPKVEGEPWVFPGGRAGKPLYSKAMLEVLGQLGRGDLTVHGFRSTFRDWASECTAYPNEVAEMALSHTVKGRAEAAYRRGDLFEKRRRLMADWAAYCEAPPRQGEVVPLKGAS